MNDETRELDQFNFLLRASHVSDKCGVCGPIKVKGRMMPLG